MNLLSYDSPWCATNEPSNNTPNWEKNMKQWPWPNTPGQQCFITIAGSVYALFHMHKIKLLTLKANKMKLYIALRLVRPSHFCQTKPLWMRECMAKFFNNMNLFCPLVFHEVFSQMPQVGLAWIITMNVNVWVEVVCVHSYEAAVSCVPIHA